MKFSIIEFSVAAAICSLFGLVFTSQDFLAGLNRYPVSTAFGHVVTSQAFLTDKVVPANRPVDAQFDMASERTKVDR